MQTVTRIPDFRWNVARELIVIQMAADQAPQNLDRSEPKKQKQNSNKKSIIPSLHRDQWKENLSTNANFKNVEAIH